MIALKTDKKGITIIELLVASAISLLAFAVLFYIAFTIQDNIGITSGILGISEKGRFAINRISKDVRESKSVIFSYAAYSTSDNVIILQVPSIDGSGDMIDPDNDFDIIIYTLDSTDPEKLLRIIDANESAGSSRVDTSETVTENIDTLLFSSQGTGLFSIADKASIKTITIKIITKTTLPGLDRQNETITSASLRNKKIGL